MADGGERTNERMERMDKLTSRGGNFGKGSGKWKPPATAIRVGVIGTIAPSFLVLYTIGLNCKPYFGLIQTVNVTFISIAGLLSKEQSNFPITGRTVEPCLN